MHRPFKTWIVCVATLTAAVQPAFAGGRGPGGGHSFGGGASRPAMRSPAAAPRINSGNSPVQIQPHARTTIVPRGNPGGAFKSATPVMAPRNGTQNGIITRGQTPNAPRNLVAGGNVNKNPGSTTLPGP